MLLNLWQSRSGLKQTQLIKPIKSDLDKYPRGIVTRGNQKDRTLVNKSGFTTEIFIILGQGFDWSRRDTRIKMMGFFVFFIE
jgi:hypothetical protein